MADDDPRLTQTLAQGGYTGVAVLTDTTGTLTPTLVTLTDGVGQVPASVGAAAVEVYITAHLPEGITARSNSFDVVWYAEIFLPLLLRAP